MESRVSFRDSDFSETKFGTGLRNGEEYQVVGKLENTTISLELLYDFITESNVRPYIKAGIGYSDNEFSAKLGGAGVSAFDAFDGVADGFYDLYATQSDNSFGWNVGLGAQYMFNKTTKMFIEYQCLSAGDSSTGQDSFTDGFTLNNSGLNEIFVGISYNF